MGKVTPHLSFVLALLLTTLAAKGDVAALEPQPTNDQFVPMGTVEYRPIHSVIGAGVDAANPPFRQCAKCQCCQGNNKTNCPSMQCCFRIKCNLPNKPFGTCAFVPEACDCNLCSGSL
ncbi:uncharacterized protein LOC103717900 [Phoenix dactylifera]|uniref:Uncharacterized protein LOC103717900 n=1 Tax=Phoenix dactylifera TaxID=42345 RepID=A0A8B7CRG1_PHODC|nr:uncharacterized protein LOC103717900 [Phoenix dactylifera]